MQKNINNERIMEPEEQLRLWYSGKSIHNGRVPGEGECCPDFSCCVSLLESPKREKYRFITRRQLDDSRFEQKEYMRKNN